MWTTFLFTKKRKTIWVYLYDLFYREGKKGDGGGGFFNNYVLVWIFVSPLSLRLNSGLRFRLTEYPYSLVCLHLESRSRSWVRFFINTLLDRESREIHLPHLPRQTGTGGRDWPISSPKTGIEPSCVVHSCSLLY